MERLTAALVRVTAGWRAGPALRVGAAVLAGVALSLAFPGPDLGPVALVALVPLLLAVETLRPGQAAALGYLSGLVFMGLLILWIPTEFLSWTGAAGWLAWVGLCLAEACFVAAFAALVPASRRLGAWRLLALPACWATLELVRAHAPLGGFPWGILGVSQHGGGPLLPLARVVGAYGLSAVIVAVNLAVAAWVRAVARLDRRSTSGPGWRSVGRVLAWPVLAVALALSGLLAPAPPPPSGAPLQLAVIQAGLLGGHGLERGASTEAVFSNHVARTEALAGQPRPDLVIWGEGAVDEDPLTNPDRLGRIRRAAAAAGAPLLVGATTAVGGDHYATEALLFTRDGQLAGHYRKRRLVPFGEYVPMASLMGRVLPVTRQGVPFDKVPGDRLRPVTVDGARIGTIICWESAYAEDPRTLTREGAQVVVVATNNASFGEGPASRQHLASSQLRAVEEGRTVVQAAVSGASAVIGPDGVARQRTGLYEQVTIRAAVVPRSGLTLYARFGQAIEAALVALAVITLVIALLPWSRRGSATAPAAGAQPAPVAQPTQEPAGRSAE
ncbi:MAG TPA: apolipoprotein N-acyltransferase [Actinomycetota bacterium]|jgi:apolipoprotein N-acyltransferase|nr:apolipoprotein N-acyltransferase [Actinomycetota bacterium]